MAKQQRGTTFAQESTRPIAQVAPYARVSTLNSQDPEMQLASSDSAKEADGSKAMPQKEFNCHEMHWLFR